TLVRNVASSAGISVVIANLTNMTTTFRSQLAEHISPFNDALQGPDSLELLRHLYGNEPDSWNDALTGFDRLRVIVNAMTRLRLCDIGGSMNFSHKESLAGAPPGYLPWFDVPNRASAGTPIVCGHWAALGLMIRSDLLGLDSGCVWGRSLSALRLDDRRVFQCDCSALLGTASER
ncbi:MAG: hypothetical protein V4637_20740, partial [Pseudomonadota bacterium]